MGVRRPAAVGMVAGRESVAVEEALSDPETEVVALAVPAEAVPVIAAAHRRALERKVVVDPTVRLGGGAISNRECLAGLELSYVRAFNTLDPAVLVDPLIEGIVPDLFFAPRTTGVERLDSRSSTTSGCGPCSWAATMPSASSTA